ncbi:I78 family peptidase inhibitor [Sphingomonas faeni]|uniref:I78 family peptidase inhibitor n=1 Tax=Sphingomonas faeni TaxID=185950 RepID=UPI00335760BA
MRIVLVAALLASAGCTPIEMRGEKPVPAPIAAACNADSLGDLVGKRASDARADVMQTRSGARTLRWIAPNTAVTMDFRPDRLNVYVDAKGRIERFTCA